MLLSILMGCRPAGPHATSAEEVGVVDQNDTIRGRDGGGSGQAWGRHVWVYGDTVLNDVDENGIDWHNNSFSITDDTDASDGVGPFVEPGDSVGQPLELIPPTEDELAFNLAHWGSEDCQVEPCGARWAVWPREPFWDDARKRALVTYGLIYAEPGDYNFEGVGGSIAVWHDPKGRPERPILDPDAEHPDLLWDADAPSWGATSRVEGDRFYTFGCDRKGLDRKCLLARMPLDEIHDLGAWEYRTRNDWSSDLDDAASLFAGGNIMSLSWNDWLDAYLLVYADGGKVKARTASELWGEWSRENVLYETDDDPYDVNHHAELEEDDGRVQYVTYSRSSGEGWFGTEFPIVRIVLAR
jgi:hypothetical protein